MDMDNEHESAVDLAMRRAVATGASYAVECASTAMYPQTQAMSYLSLGLCSEAGEFIGVVMAPDAEPSDQVSELGDVLWYIFELCRQTDISHTEVIKNAFGMLRDRGSLPTHTMSSAIVITQYAGVIAGIQKKVLRGDDVSAYPSGKRVQMVQAIIMVMTASVLAAQALGTSIDQVMLQNSEKLSRRAAAGTIKGDGNER